MSVQENCQKCQKCGGLWNFDSLVYIGYEEKNMCPSCIDGLVWGLVISNKHMKGRLIKLGDLVELK